jgi:hypothetical protein
MGFPKDAPVKPPGGYLTSLGAYFLIIRIFTPIKQTHPVAHLSMRKEVKI